MLKIAILISGLMSTFLVGCNKTLQTEAPKKPLPLVETRKLLRGDIAEILPITGDAVVTNRVVIAPNIEGPVVFCPWREGDVVKKGEKLIAIFRPVFEADVLAGKASLHVAEAKLRDLKVGSRAEEIEKARQSLTEAEATSAYEQSDFDRITLLVKEGSVPKEDLEKSRLRLVSAQAKAKAAKQQLLILESGPTPTTIAVQESLVEEAGARLKQAEAKNSESMIPAPFDGIITKVWVRVGDQASLKTPLLELADPKSMVLRGSIPESHALAVRPDMSATISFDALPDKKFSGRIVRLYPELDPVLRTRTVEILPLEKMPDLPSMFARIDLKIRGAKGVLLAPRSAVIPNGKGQFRVVTIRDDKTELRPVETGLISRDFVEIRSGAKEGEWVAVSGHEKLKAGVQIKVAGNKGSLK